jgi:hypothetical protein
MRTSETLNPVLDKIRFVSLIVGVAGLAIAATVWVFHPEQFFRSYLVGYLLWIGISLGSLSLLMLHHMVGGRWGFVIRRILEAATRTLPLMLVLFLPLLLGLDFLYEWARPEEVAHDEILQHKAPYLNVPFFVIRAGLYFAVWIGLSFFLSKLSGQQDQENSEKLQSRFRSFSAPGIGLYALTVTFASIDWVMSLEAHWFSTIYGLLYVASFALITLAFCVIVLQLLSKHEPLASVVRDNHFHDLGNLILAFVMLWAYLSFSQYLIVWSANLPEEVPWYVHRLHGGWQYLGLFLIVFHFAIPFFLLLLRTTKKSGRQLAGLAALLVIVRLADLIFLVVPPLSHGGGLNIQWTDIVVPLGIGGFWITIFATKLKERSLLPLNDPRFVETGQHNEVLDHG